MPSVSLLNTEWGKVCDAIDFYLKNIILKENRIINEVSTLLAPYNLGSEKFHIYQLGTVVYWAQESYSYKSKNKTATVSELHKLSDTIKRLEELEKEAQHLQNEYRELKAIYRKTEEASKKRNGFLERAAESSSVSSSSSGESSIDKTILTDPWGY